ncbi:hypothetical protein PCASD_01854 [Puccinia coronata f. sp. avenae]|uniref:Uncharacterized protein n=1 Tax=Puccinia coronata f. sp. avenae TaxID=200324 RepID=A0A2N5VJL9_9BASI|nr:hypothetical protein PCASD_01854 [Puccinia coronata f. sp. avenae]
MPRRFSTDSRVELSVRRMAPSKNAKGNAIEDDELKGRRVVWKPVLSTPFTYRWPEVPDEVGNQFLVELLRLLDNHEESHDSEQSPSSNISRSQDKTQLGHLEGDKHRLGLPHSTHVVELRSGKKLQIPNYVPPPRSKLHPNNLKGDEPGLSKRIKCANVISGINSTTKELEKEIQQKRETLPHTCSANFTTTDQGSSSTTEARLHEKPPQQQLSFIFVCRGDMNPLDLVDHLLPTIANLNRYRLQTYSSEIHSTVSQPLVILIPLPKGAENQIALALGIKRAAIVALKGRGVRVSALSKLAEDHIEPILPPNIISIAGCSKASPKSFTNESVALLPTHIKHYKTTAPTDMRKHQLERLQNKKQHIINHHPMMTGGFNHTWNPVKPNHKIIN